MTSSSKLHPLTLLAILLAAQLASPAPTHTSSDGASSLVPLSNPRSTSHPNWHLLLALWRPKDDVITTTGSAVQQRTEHTVPTVMVSPTIQVSPVGGALSSEPSLITGVSSDDSGEPQPSQKLPLEEGEEVVLLTAEGLPARRDNLARDFPPAAYVAQRASAVPLEGITPFPEADEHEWVDGTPQHHVTQQHPRVNKMSQDQASEDMRTVSYVPETKRQAYNIPAASFRSGSLSNVESSSEIYVPTTAKTVVDGRRGEDPGVRSEGTSATLTTEVVEEEVMATIATHIPEASTVVLETSSVEGHLDVPHPALSGRQIETETSSNTSSAGASQLPEGSLSGHFFMHPLPQHREAIHAPDEVHQEPVNTTGNPNTYLNFTSMEDHPQRPYLEESGQSDTAVHHSERGRKVLQFQGRVVMETLDGPSLVPLVGPSKGILNLKNDERAILALLKVAHGPDTLEPLHINPVMQTHEQVTSDGERTDKLSPAPYDSVIQVPADDSNTNDQRTDPIKPPDSSSEPRGKLAVLIKKETKFLDRKSMNAIDAQEKDSHAKDDLEESETSEGVSIVTTAKPIYEEISDTLKVDTSIDDVEDFDVQVKHTENTDDFLPATNQSHTNLIDVTLHGNQSALAPGTEPPSFPPTTVPPSSTTSSLPQSSTTSQSSGNHPTVIPPRPEEDTTATTEDVDGWSFFVANISGISNSSLALNESVFHRASGMSTEQHYKMVLQERGSLMVQLMDPSADPCDDFYQFACGRWNGKFPIRQDKAVDNTFERLKEDLDDVLRSLLEEPPLHTDNNITRAVKTLYAGCMNTEAIEALGATPLLELLKELGGWPVLDGEAWNDTGYDWVRQMARLRNYNNDILVSEWVAADITNSSNHIIQLDQPELGLPGREYFINPGDYQYREAYLNLMLSVTHLLGAPMEVALQDMTEVLHFEKKVSSILTAAEERRNLSAVHRRMTLDDLVTEVPEIDWAGYLETITWRNNNTEELVVFGLDYFRKLVELLKDTENRTISNYLLWRFVKNRISNLGERYTKIKQDYIKVLFGRKTQPERWRSCVTYVSGNLGYVVGAMFVKRYFPEASKNDTDEMIYLIRDSFKTALYEARWMDEETRGVAQEKVDTIVKNVGYPEYLLNDTYMDEVYSELSFNPDTHFDNVLKMLQFHARTNHNLLAIPVNRTAWVTSPAVVNAYYSRSKNMIVFPAGILQPPFYHPAFPRSLNYGGIGVVIGHEITHGFDDRGRQFDKNGNLQQWWKPEDVSKFYQRASCMLDQYGEYRVDDVGLKINPVNTLGENIADNAGIKISYQAYQNWRKNNEETVTMPYVNLTHEQLFFLNFGQIWCEVNSPEAMLTKIRSGQHSPNKFRVIGTLSNSVEFNEAFNCPVGSRMNPERKCRVW